MEPLQEMDDNILVVANENIMFKDWMILEESETERFLMMSPKYIMAFPLVKPLYLD